MSAFRQGYGFRSPFENNYGLGSRTPEAMDSYLQFKHYVSALSGRYGYEESLKAEQLRGEKYRQRNR